MKKTVTDKKFILGLGVGFLISAVLILAQPPAKISKAEVEKMAKDMGMVYLDDVKALYSK